MISIKNASKLFTTKSGEIQAVDEVSLDIQKGEIFGVIGYSGAGKSTLIRMLNGLEIPTSGSVSVEGMEVSKIKGGELRKARQNIGMIFQHFNLLWSRTVGENIAFPLEIAGVPAQERKKRVKELIRLVGLDGREDAYPQQLSGGQKQRVGIARALANNPKVLLCDEATSALDPQTTESILDLLVSINKEFGLTIVLITHEMHVIRKICHRVAVMESGRVVEVGNVLDIFRQPKADITKKFVKQVSGRNESDEASEAPLAGSPDGKTIKLTFFGKAAEQPVITELIRGFELTVSILQGNISQTQNGAYGVLYVHIDGDEAELNRAMEFLHVQEVGVEAVSANV